MQNKVFFTLFLAACSIFISQSCENSRGEQGAQLYKIHCSNCHAADGTGLEGLIPPLKNADYLKENQTILPCLIKKGISGEILVNGKTYGTQVMPPMPQLSDVVIANIISYINTAWGNDYGKSNLIEVQKALEGCQH